MKTKATGVKKLCKGVKAGVKKSKERNLGKELMTFPRQATIKDGEYITLPNIWEGNALPIQHRTRLMEKLVLHIRCYHKTDFFINDYIALDTLKYIVTLKWG